MSESALNLQIPFLSRQISHIGKYTHYTIYMIYLLYTLQQCGADSTDEMGHSPWWLLFELPSWYPINLVKSLQLIWRSDTVDFIYGTRYSNEL